MQHYSPNALQCPRNRSFRWAYKCQPNPLGCVLRSIRRPSKSCCLRIGLRNRCRSSGVSITSLASPNATCFPPMCYWIPLGDKKPRLVGTPGQPSTVRPINRGVRTKSVRWSGHVLTRTISRTNPRVKVVKPPFLGRRLLVNPNFPLIL